MTKRTLLMWNDDKIIIDEYDRLLDYKDWKPTIQEDYSLLEVY